MNNADASGEERNRKSEPKTGYHFKISRKSFLKFLYYPIFKPSIKIKDTYHFMNVLTMK